MKDSLIIPDNIQVGFNTRTDTYTGKLAYVVYKDAKGKLRKEGSWNSWCDKKIPKESYKNEPVSGFVLNKDVGGTRHSYGSWNARVEKVRVYDPRGFEFEIDIPNLLYILQECSSIKGKGLEGDFVYSWSGPNLVLLPTSSQEYKESSIFTQLQTESVSAKDMEVGHTYINKNRKNLMYMGKHVWFDNYQSYGRNVFGKKMHVFAIMDGPKANLKEDEDDDFDPTPRGHYLLETGFSKIAKKTSTSPSPQYAEEYTRLMKQSFVSIPTGLMTKPLKKIKTTDYYTRACIEENGVYYMGNIQNTSYRYAWDKQENVPQKYNIECDSIIRFENGQVVREWFHGVNYEKRFVKKNLTEEEVLAMARTIYVVCENGSKYKVES